MEVLNTVINILYVEDDSQDAKLAKEYFRAYPDFRLEIAVSGREGVKLFNQNKYDAIILDNNLNDMTGIDILKILSAKNDQTPVIMLTGSRTEELVIQALRMGARDFIFKNEEYLTRLPLIVKKTIEENRVKTIYRNESIKIIYLDSSTDQETVNLYLSEKAPHITTKNINSGKELLKLLDIGNDFDILLMELFLPDTTALELIKELKYKGINIPFIILTGMGNEELSVASLKLGASDYIIKSENYLALLPNSIELAYLQSKLRKEYLKAQENEKELAKSKEMFKDLAENSGIVFWIRDLESNKITYISSGYQELTGKSCESLYEDVNSFIELIHPEDMKIVTDNNDNRGNGTSEAIFRIITSNGSIKWIKTRSNPVKEIGKINSLVGSIQDITQFKETELSLTTTSERLNFLISENTAVIFTARISEDFGTTFISENVFDLTGFKASEFTEDASFWMSHVHPDDLNMMLTGFPDISVNQSHVAECRFLTASGTYIWIQYSMKIVKNENGVPEEIIGYYIDITQRKSAEEKLQESEARFRNSFDHAAIGMAINSLDGKFLEVNQSLCKILGYTEEELLVKDYISLTHPDDLEISFKKVNDLKEKNIQHAHFEKRYIHKSGAIVSTILSITLSHDKEGNALYFINQIEDITEQKASEDKLKEQAALLDVTSDAVMVRDINNNILYWNKGAEKLYNYNKDEVIGKNAIGLIYKEKTPELDLAIKKVLKDGKWQGELNQFDKEGSLLMVDSKWTLITDQNGRTVSIMIVNTDITQKKHLETEYLRIQRLESIGTLASGIAHDLNNVLSPIMMSLELLKMRTTDTKGLNLIEAMNKSTQYGAQLVKQVLTFARGLEGKHQTLALEKILKEVEEITGSSLPANIELITDIPEELKKINGDPTQLNQVIMNLLVNARDAMPNGGKIKISARNIYLDKTFVMMNPEAIPGNYVLISILDSGTGIPKHLIDKIFEPFFTTKEVGKGTGLGLSTTIGIIKSHSGFINVTSKERHGTEFKIYLPVSVVNEDINSNIDSEIDFTGNGETILLIEDEFSIVEAAKQTLEMHNYNVLKAYDGVEGLTLYVQNHENIKLVITDIMLPIMDGNQLVKAIFKINPGERIIAMSGVEKSTTMNEYGDRIKFLNKPFIGKTLLMAIKEKLSDI
jgi:PAS domain S-box-containing protein